MKKTIALLLSFLFLTGCSSPVWETVDDTTEVPAASWLDDVYSVQITVPSDMQCLAACDGWELYSTDDGKFEVETRTFPASDLNTAVEMLTGFPASNLTVLQTERFGFPEYQFAWLTQTEQGSRLCRADLVMNDTECYAVICSTDETASETYAGNIRQIISSFGLYVDEGV